MISFTLNSRKDTTIVIEGRLVVAWSHLSEEVIDCKRVWGNFLGDRFILYFDCGGVSMTVSNYQISQNVYIKWILFYINHNSIKSKIIAEMQGWLNIWK